jgi:hypothetical protein
VAARRRQQDGRCVGLSRRAVAALLSYRRRGQSPLEHVLPQPNPLLVIAIAALWAGGMLLPTLLSGFVLDASEDEAIDVAESYA